MQQTIVYEGEHLVVDWSIQDLSAIITCSQGGIAELEFVVSYGQWAGSVDGQHLPGEHDVAKLLDTLCRALVSHKGARIKAANDLSYAIWDLNADNPKNQPDPTPSTGYADYDYHNDVWFDDTAPPATSNAAYPVDSGRCPIACGCVGRSRD